MNAEKERNERNISILRNVFPSGAIGGVLGVGRQMNASTSDQLAVDKAGLPDGEDKFTTQCTMYGYPK
uniref:Uncharacterized protein n=1 Tax=Setaria digitata TaxID=48799 RepID=A0A915PXY3_9BILA